MHHLPVTIHPAAGEALDGYLERLAAANALERPRLMARLTTGPGHAKFLCLAPHHELVRRIADMAELGEREICEGTLAALAGIDTADLDPTSTTSWRRLAARGWPPEHGSALCPGCLAADGAWRIVWRHPWVTACLDHAAWLVGQCPSCGIRFRSQRTPLRSVDAAEGTCGNPAGARGRNCPQPLAALPTNPAPSDVLGSQERINAAIRGHPIAVLGQDCPPGQYLAEIKALTVLLLHLAAQPGGEQRVGWAELARADHHRSEGTRGARWCLAPPADLILRGLALGAADHLLIRSSLDEAADALHGWTELVPPTNDGQLGWLADHTTMTPTLTRLVMVATATRRRLATLLNATPPAQLPLAAIPQVLPAHVYAGHLADMLEVTEPTGRLFAALCLARRHTAAATWADSATALGLPGETGSKTARACNRELLAGPRDFITALDAIAEDLDPGCDHRARELAVRRLATGSGWYRRWARVHHAGSHTASQQYAVTWLWTEYAHGHIGTSPGWQHPPDRHDRAHYRAYTGRLGPTATEALTSLVHGITTAKRRTT